MCDRLNKSNNVGAQIFAPRKLLKLAKLSAFKAKIGRTVRLSRAKSVAVTGKISRPPPQKRSKIITHRLNLKAGIKMSAFASTLKRRLGSVAAYLPPICASWHGGGGGAHRLKTVRQSTPLNKLKVYQNSNIKKAAIAPTW